MFRTLPAAFALVAALFTIAVRDPAVGTTSLRQAAESCATARESFTADEATVTSGPGVSLAQKTLGIGKVTLPRAQKTSWDMVLRGVLTAVILVCVIIAYGGFHGFGEHAPSSFGQPRRLAEKLMHPLGNDKAAKATRDAASRNVALLKAKGFSHRLVRRDEGEDGVLDDDRDYAKIRGYLGRAEAYAQRQQYEKAAEFFREAVHMAEGWLTDLKKDHTNGVEIEEASLQVSDAVAQAVSFFLERGQTMKARKVLKKAAPLLQGRTDTNAMRILLLAATVDQDAGKLDEATAGYKKVLEKIASVAKDASKSERAVLDELLAETNGERARAMISQGHVSKAMQIVEEVLQKLPESSSLVSRFNGLLGIAHLKQGEPARAIDSLDAALAGLGDLPSGLAGATTDVQEIMQTRAAAKAALGRVHSATEDLDVVRGLQDELLQTVNDGHNPDYAFGEGLVPDPRLWASLARTTMIAAELKLKNGHAKEAVTLARKALHLLREVKQTDGRVPKGCSLATFVEVKEMLAKAKKARGAVAFLAKKSQEEKEEDESEASHDETIEGVAETEEDALSALI